MPDTTPTPAEAIPFALVDEAGHLTGKPAEGVATQIREAIAALPAAAGLDENQLKTLLEAHEAQILRAWQEDPTYSKAISGISQQAFAGKNDDQRPGDLWLYLISAATAGASKKTFEPLGAIFSHMLSDDWRLKHGREAQELIEKILPNGWSPDNAEKISRLPEVGEQVEAGNHSAIMGAIAARLLIEAALVLLPIKGISFTREGILIDRRDENLWGIIPVQWNEPFVVDNEE